MTQRLRIAADPRRRGRCRVLVPRPKLHLNGMSGAPSDRVNASTHASLLAEDESLNPESALRTSRHILDIGV